MSATASVWLGLSLLMQAASPTAEQQAASAPVWLTRPTGDDIERVFPAVASRENRSGAATLKCAISADGRMRDCRVVAEQPQGFGFGDAVLRLAPRFRLKPPVHEGATIVLPIRFVVPEQTEAVRSKLRPGEGAALVTVLDGAAPQGSVTVACGSAAAPDRRCQLHSFEWVAMPSATRSDALLAKSDQWDGVALMECKVTDAGALAGCKVGGASQSNEVALLELANDFRAPHTAIDGATLTSGRVVLRFDWKLLASLKAPLNGVTAKPSTIDPSSPER